MKRRRTLSLAKRHTWRPLYMKLAETLTERTGYLRGWKVYEEAVVRGQDISNFSVSVGVW